MVYTSKRIYDILFYFLLILLSALAGFLAIKNIVLSADSMVYGLTSQQILAGNGLRTPIIWFDSNAIPVNGTVPLLMHPPLLPVIFALLGGLTPQSFVAAQILNLVCHVLISVFTFLLMINIYGNKKLALLSGILVSFSFPILKNCHHVWSETFFTALVTGAIYFLTLSRHTHGSKYRRNVLLAAGFASAAILTRNAGIAILTIFLWEAYMSLKNRRPELHYKSTFIAASLPFFTVAALYARNYFISGLIRGEVQFQVDNTYPVAFVGTIKMLFQQFQLGRPFTISIILLTVCFIAYTAINSDARNKCSKFFALGLDIIIIFMVSYTALICIAMAEQQPRFETRFMSPLVPFIFIVIIFATVFIWERVQLKAFPKMGFYGTILSLFLISSLTFYKTYLNLPEFLSRQTGLEIIENSCVFRKLINSYEKHELITTNKPYHVSFLGGYSTIRLPYKGFIESEKIPDKMDVVLPNRMSHFGSHILVLFGALEEKYYGKYMEDLFSKRVTNEDLLLEYECPDGMIFNLRK